MVALTAVLQAGDRLATLVCRQTNASLPPGLTPEHFDMNSERQFERMVLCCSGVTCAAAVAVKAASARAADAKVRGQPLVGQNLIGEAMVSPHFHVRASLARMRPARTWKILGAHSGNGAAG